MKLERWANEYQTRVKFEKMINGGLIITILNTSKGWDGEPVITATLSDFRTKDLIKFLTEAFV